MNRYTPAIIVTLLLGGALAQANAPLTLDLVMNLVKTVNVNGKSAEQLVPSPKTVVPGDVLSQVVTVRNVSAKSISSLPVKLPVPKSTVYLAPEAGMNVARTEYSIDGGKTFATAPLKKTITVTENGKSVQKEVEVSPSEYTTVRWTVSEIAAGQSLKLGYRVQVK